MRAIVYKKPNSVSVETVPDPKLEAPTDAVVRITTAGREARWVYECWSEMLTLF